MTTAAPAAPAAPAPAAAPAAAPAGAPAQPAAQPAAAPAAPAPAPAAQPAPAEAPKSTILGGEPSKEGAKPGEAPKQEGAPEKYADFKLPEGVEIKKPLLEAFTAAAKELNLSQTAAQKLVDLQAQNVVSEIHERLTAFNAQVEEWGKQTREAFGAEWNKQSLAASKAVERFGSPELRQLLNDSGLGNHPEMVKMFARVGLAISEDTPVDGRKAGGDKVPTEKLMFPTMEKKSS